MTTSKTTPRNSPAGDAEIQRAVNLKASGMSNAEIAKTMNRATQTVGGWLLPGGRAERMGIKPGDVAGEWETARLTYEDRIRDLEAQIGAFQREKISAQQIREMIGNLNAELPDPPKWAAKPAKSGSPGVPLTLWSDWHIGEVVSLEQTGGVNEFNMDIAQKRVRRLVEKIIDLAFNHQTNPDYPGIVVCLGGDLISGIIHQELIETMESPFAGQLLETYAMLSWALTALADRFGRVFVVCVVGNHGRLWHKPRAKNRVFDSFEYILYSLLESRFCPVDGAGKKLPGYDERFQFHVPAQTDALFQVAGHRFLLTHGDSTGAKGGDGIIGAIGPIVRGEKKVREVSGYTHDDYDTALMGHYHQMVSLDTVVVNPTLKGYDEYARNVLRARPEPPAQMLLFVHQDYGIIDQRRVFLEKKPRQTPASWVAWKS